MNKADMRREMQRFLDATDASDLAERSAQVCPAARTDRGVAVDGRAPDLPLDAA